MATIKIEIPTAIEDRAVRALSDYFGYTPKLQKSNDKGEPYEENNPESRKQFAGRMLGEYVQEIVTNYEYTLEQAQARENKKQQIKNEFKANV